MVNFNYNKHSNNKKKLFFLSLQLKKIKISKDFEFVKMYEKKFSFNTVLKTTEVTSKGYILYTV